MLNWLKYRYRKKYISKNLSQRNRDFVSLKGAKQLGIVATIANKEEYLDIFSIFSQLQQMEKNVKMIAYIDEKEVPYYCLQQLTADYFCQKNMNWYGKLMMPQLVDFMNEKFDMLVDFTHRFYTPIQTVLSLSKSRMIVGGNSTQKELYDLFIDMNGATDNRQLLENIVIYTSKLTGKIL